MAGGVVISGDAGYLVGGLKESNVRDFHAVDCEGRGAM